MSSVENRMLDIEITHNCTSQILGIYADIDYEKFINSLHDIYILYPTLYSCVLISIYLNTSLRVNHD